MWNGYDRSLLASKMWRLWVRPHELKEAMEGHMSDRLNSITLMKAASNLLLYSKYYAEACNELAGVSVGRRIVLVMPVDTLYRTSIISSTILPLNPFVNLSLAPPSLFLIYGPDLGVWPNCWVSAEFARGRVAPPPPVSRAHLRVIAPGKTGFFEEMSLRWRAIGNTVWFYQPEI